MVLKKIGGICTDLPFCQKKATRLLSRHKAVISQEQKAVNLEMETMGGGLPWIPGRKPPYQFHFSETDPGTTVLFIGICISFLLCLFLIINVKRDVNEPIGYSGQARNQGCENGN